MYGNTYQPTYYPMFNQPTNQPAFNPSGLSGRIVDDFGMITVNDVPMDGSPSVFVKRDNSEIQIRRWGNDGRIYNVSYLPQIEAKAEETTISTDSVKQSEFDALAQRLEGIESKLDKLLRPVKGKEVKDES